MKTSSALIATLLMLFPIAVHAQERREFRVGRAIQPPKIDGVLDDDVWDDDPLVLGNWISYNPLYGTMMPQRTEVRIAYDDRNLYFAFHCLDSEPDKIKTTISRRDSVFNDDWVGLSLDSNNSGQTAYHLFVNPSGIQMDALNTSASSKADVGLSAKYGITSSITLDATINPDFSQVESDAFQVQVNQRFPIFYSEKRPFFMEGLGLFNLAGTGGDGNMVTAVHTRKIIDPSWGSKVTGTQGRFTFGLLNASDDTPEDLGNGGTAITGKDKFFNIGRLTYGLGESNYVGGIFVDTEHAGRHNRVAGGDLSIRFQKRHQFSATFLDSRTAVDSAQTDGTAEQVYYSFSDRKYAFSTQIEHNDNNFQMGTAFYNRTGFTSGWGYGELNFYPKNANSSALKRLSLFTWAQVQIFRWLNLNGNFNNGWATFYDPVDPFAGRSRSAGGGFSFQLNQHVNQNVSYSRVRFNRASDGGRVYTVHIVNVRSTYQFNKHFLVRAIEQFDSSRSRVLLDLLASYEFVPGTVVHAGYGSLFEKTDYPEYLTTSRGLFFKASYLHRF